MNPFKLFSAHDLLAFAGCICAGFGLWQIHPPTALIVIGVGAIAAGYLLDKSPK